MKNLQTAAARVCAFVLISSSILGHAQNAAASSVVVHTTTAVRQVRTKRLGTGPGRADGLHAPFARRTRTGQSHKPRNSGTITYTCDPSISASTCNYLNTTIANEYSSAFTNANANIYITYGTTGLGESVQYPNLVTYGEYVGALTSNPNQSAVQTAALSALNTYDSAPYSSDYVEVTAALGTALGFSGLTGITTGYGGCTLGTSGCYNAIIVITNDPSTTLYYDNIGGPEPGDAYDFYGVVEHETDEVLGTSSCIDTQEGPLTDDCDFDGGPGNPSAADLFRYNGAGQLAVNASYLGAGSAPAGAYFSYNGGTTNGANGIANTGKVYNTVANGADYADFLSSSPDCGTDIAIQDADGCPGEDAGLTILNDGGGEINILNAVGYDLPAQLCAPGTYSNTGSAPCTPAPAGSYVSGSGATSATYCSAGTYQPNTGQTACLAAPAGSYVSGPGSALATLCSPGYYQPNTGQTACLASPAGSVVSYSGAIQPTLCAPGFYQPNTGQTACLASPAGYFVPSPGAITPTLCSPGKYQPNTGSVSCFLAPAGSYVSGPGSAVATLCSPGFYQPNTGQTACIASQPGSYVPNSGATSATACAAGSYSSSTAATACTLAPAGSYVANSGSSYYLQCAAGSYQPNTGQTSCILAGIGYYVANPGQANETQCPAGETTTALGSTSCVLVLLTASPSLINFPNVHPDAGYTERVAVKNIGGAPIMIGTASITSTGGDPNAFTLKQYCTSMLKSGKTCYIGVTFRPSQLGLSTATLNIPFSGAGNPLEVSLGGTAVKK
jgi:hypothetical protein